MELHNVIDPKRIDQIPDKVIVLLSEECREQEFQIKRIELRSYLHKKDEKLGSYRIITTYVDTDQGSIENIFDEGYKDANAIESAAAYITSHLTLQTIIRNSVEQIRKSRGKPSKIIQEKSEFLCELMKKKGFLSKMTVEDAIKRVPRHLFVPSEFIEEAYEDKPLPTKNGQTISQPSVVARMTEWLDVKEDHKVLEIGCGSGWQSAIISKLVTTGKVFTIERFPEIIKFAKENHKKAGIKNVEIVKGDGTLGLQKESPFDRIIITAACPKIPISLIDQLDTNGLIIAPVGEPIQTMTLLRKTFKGISQEKTEYGYVFAPLIGKHGFKSYK